MTTKKIEIKVDIDCEKCKRAIMEAVAELEGVNHVSLDQEKSILTVVGTMDPVCVAEQLKKIKQKPVVISVGPPKKPDPKPDPKKDPCFPYYYYTPCDMVTVSSYESGSGCTIV
ncbi:PREDICTED: heavy metal-associated isoprenylated plant protein 27 [Camelina sativa]|uniref:Heavy metal-associated isoprenylated plant protein 27 n=1 Tax=Camelina sativa TaxID=90675 RepID=A0ABM0VEL8_CAMSA|nr:PREDICTED: heavy metal-associated isoprenylated plant protein 27 [Camelina sativa]